MEWLKKIKENLIFYIFILLIIFLAYFIINRFNYFDAPHLCYISLTPDILSGNKTTMHRAIDRIKKSDPEDYKDLCRYVEAISEKYCVAFDARVESRSENVQQPGCFVKGSKTIYLKPEKEASDSIIEQRAAAIKKFMLMSKSFWKNQK